VHDVALRSEIGRDIHVRVGEQQSARMPRQVDAERMRQPPLGTQPRARVGHRSEQVLVREAASDQRGHRAFAREFGGAQTCRPRLVGGVHDGQPRNIQPGKVRGVADSHLGADQRRNEVPGEGTGERHLQRLAVAGVGHRRGQRRPEPGPFGQPLEVRASSHGASLSSTILVVNDAPTGGAWWRLPGRSPVAAAQHTGHDATPLRA